MNRERILRKLRESNSAYSAQTSSAPIVGASANNANSSSESRRDRIISKMAKAQGGRTAPSTPTRKNTYGVDDVVWGNVQRYSDAIGNYDWRSKYEYDLLDTDDLRRKSQGLIPLELEERYDLENDLDRELYSEGLPSSKDIADIAEAAQKASIKAGQEQREREETARNYERYSSARSVFDRALEMVNNADKRAEAEEVFNSYAKKAFKDPDSTEGRAYYWLADKMAQNDAEEAREYIQKRNRELEYTEQGDSRLLGNVLTDEYAEKINALQPQIAQLAQQYDAIDEQISYITASPYGMDESRAQELEALRQQQAQIKSQMDAVNTQVAGLEQQRIDYRMAEREAEISAALQPYADIPNAADFEQYAQQGAQTVNGGWLDSDAEKHNYINRANQNAVGQLSAEVMTDYTGYNIYDYMTDEERDIYNYVFAKDGKEASRGYLEALTPVLNRRYTQEVATNSAQFAEDVPVLSDIVSVLYSIPKAGGAVYSLLAGDSADPYDPMLAAGAAQSAIRGTRTEQLGGVGGFLYNAGMSMLDTILSRGVGGKASLGIMGAGAMADTYQAALERGADPGQALTVGALAAISEAVFEKFSLDNWVGLKTAGRGKAVLNILRSMGVEASEEMATEVANIVSDMAVMGELGETHGKSLAELGGQVLLAGAGGALSGGVFGVGGTAINRYNARQQAAAEQAAAQAQQQAEAEPANDRQIENAQETGVLEAEQDIPATDGQISPEEVSEVETPEQRAAEEAEIMYIPNVVQYRPGVNRAFTNAGIRSAVERELTATGIEATPENRRAARENVMNQLRGLKLIGERYDVKIAVHDTLENDANGRFDPETGVIHVSLNAIDNAYMYVATHELVHYVKSYNADGYTQLEQTVMEALAASGEDVDALVKYQMDAFKYDEATAREEVIANSVPAILTDENIVRQLTQGDRTIAQKIMDFVRGLVQSLKNVANRLKGQESWRQLESLNKDIDTLNGIYDSFRAALQDTAVRGETGARTTTDEKFSIKYDKNNTAFVAVEKDILGGVEQKDWVKTVKDNFRESFPSGIVVGSNEIDINSKTAKEMTYSKYTRYLMEHEPELYADKLRATNNADEIIRASRDYVNEALNHPRKDDIQEFARGKVNLRIGESDYSADVVVAMRKNGRLLLYDILSMNRISILEKNGRNKPVNLNNREAERSVASNEKITQDEGTVKYSAKDPLVRTFEQLEQDNERMAAQIQEQQQVIDALNSRSELAEQREAALRKAYDEARSELRRTEGIKPNAKKAADAAARIVREYGTKYGRDVLAQDIMDIYEGFSSSTKSGLEVVEGDIVYRAIAQRVHEVAKGIAKDISVVDSTVYEQTEEMRGYFRSSTIGFDEGQIGEIEVQYGSLNAYRKALFGKVNISKDGMGIDGLWAEMSELYPEYFPADTASGDQPRVLFDVLQSVYDRPVVQPYANDQDAIGDIEATIWDAVLSVPQKVTVADKLAQAKAESRDFESQLKKAQKDIRALKREMRAQAKAAYKDSERVAWWESTLKRKDLSDKYNALLAEESSIKDRSDRQSVERKKEISKEKNRLRSEYRKVSSQQTDAMAVEREWQRENRERAKERHKGSELRVRIHNKAKALLSWLMRPTEKGLKYVPEYMKNAVANLLRALDFSGKTPTKKAADWRGALEKLELTLRRAEKDENADDLVFEWDTYADIQKLLEETEGVFEVRSLTTAQLERLDKILSGVQHSIKTANELDVAGRKRELDEMARKIIAELSGKQARHIGKIGEAVKGFLMWDTITPVYAFERMGGTFSQLFGDLEEAQRTLAFTGEDARAFYNSLHNEYDVDKWRDVKNDTFRFTTQRGDEIELTRGQALSLYATMKRETLDTEQGARHLSIGGFVYDREVKVVTKETVTEDGETKKEKVTSYRDAKPKPLTEADIEKIKKEFLTPQQLEFADKAVEYMSTTLADLGNETSVKQSGFKKFGKTYYFPYKVSSNYTPTSLKASSDGDKGLRNAGFTKATVAGARNPVVLQDFFEVFESHTQDMLTYHAFSIAQENVLRVLNWHDRYAEGETAMSVKTALENALGPEAVKYVETFLRDLGGGIVTDPRESRLTRGIGSFKRAATMAKASVVVQQFSSVFRAWSMINPKYFASKPMKGAYKQLMRYSGAAVMKRIGGFDTGTGTGEWITDTPVKGAKNKARSFFSKDGKYRNEVFGAAPRFMDEIAWSWIWQAVKKETAAKMGLKPNEISTEKHLAAAGKRFDEVIQKTQVYDSVLSKNPLMRSKSGLAKMVTAFMGEPGLMYSMLVDSVTNVKNKGGVIKHTGPIIGALVLSILVNGASRALTSAAYDDDEEKTYWEKWLDSFVEGLIGQPIKLGWTKDATKIYGITSDFNPLTWLPLVNDVLSIFQGYDVERTDISLMSDLRDAIWGLSSESKEPYEKGRDLVGALANFTGLPVKNIARDIEAVIRVIGEVIG